MVNNYNYTAAKKEWTCEQEQIVKLYLSLDDDVPFRDYLDAFKWIGNHGVFASRDHRFLARERLTKFKRSAKSVAPSFEFKYELYSQLMNNPLVEQLYRSINGTTLSPLPPLPGLPNNPYNSDETTTMSGKSPNRIIKSSRKKAPTMTSEVSVDHSFTNNDHDDDDLSYQMGTLALANKSSGATKGSGLQTWLMNVNSSDNPNEIMACITTGRTSSDGQAQFKTLDLQVPIDHCDDEEFYELRISEDHSDINSRGITALKFTYPVCSTSRPKLLDQYLEMVSGAIDDFNVGNHNVNTEVMNSDQRNRVWAFNQAIRSDINENLKPTKKTIKLKMPMYEGQQLAISPVQHFQGSDFETKPSDDLVITPALIACLDSLISWHGHYKHQVLPPL